MRVQLFDMAARLESMQPDLDAAIARVMAHGRFVSGPEVADFEAAWGRYCGAEHAVGVASGTDALTLALRAAGVGPGDEVITSAFTFVATVESIVQCGAVPVLVDPEPDTALIAPAAAAEAITGRTAALVPVHLYGQCVDLDGFRALADRHGLLLAEDAAQAHGARWNSRVAGSVGDVAAFSFFPAKNLGAMGDAGAVTTRDAAVAGRVAKLRDHGRVDKYRHDVLATNARLDTLQAAVLLVGLARLDDWNDARRRIAARYDDALAGVEGVEPIAVAAPATPVYHQYVVRVEDRDGALEHLRRRGVGAGVHYPIPLHRQPALVEAGLTADLPHADALAGSVLSLPMFPELDDRGIAHVVEALAEHAERAAGARSLR